MSTNNISTLTISWCTPKPVPGTKRQTETLTPFYRLAAAASTQKSSLPARLKRPKWSNVKKREIARFRASKQKKTNSNFARCFLFSSLLPPVRMMRLTRAENCAHLRQDLELYARLKGETGGEKRNKKQEPIRCCCFCSDCQRKKRESFKCRSQLVEQEL